MEAQARFVLLPTGAVIDLENIAAILGHELNTKFIVVPKASASPQAPVLSADEFEAFFAELESRGLAFRVAKPAAKPAVATA